MDCDVEMNKIEDSDDEIVVKIPLLTFKFDPVNFPLYELARDQGTEMRGENRPDHLSIISIRQDAKLREGSEKSENHKN